jgi:KDO2-lipid IV(A) lauroyltransferase
MKTIKYFFQATLIYILFIIIKIIGLNRSRNFFSYIFKKIGTMIKSKKIINKNLDKVPLLDKKNIVDNMWSNYGMTFVEYMFLKKFKNNNSHITIKGAEILDKLKINAKPVIFISGHFANFELMSMELNKYKMNLATVYRPLNNFFLNPFMEFIRKKYICEYQIKKGIAGIRDIVNYLKSDFSIALMVDQRVGEGKRFNFFNHAAHTTSLPAQLALKNSINIVPVYISRKKDNFFEMEIYKPIETSKLTDTEENRNNITLNINKIIEEMILRNPGQWIWTHNRWK